jgi:glycosyltransferase involved in cell wall biosynthesis
LEGREMALKIGIISHAKHTICEPFAGGLEAHTAYLAQALIRNGHAVTLFSAGHGAAPDHVEFFCRQTVDFATLGDGGFEYEHYAYHDLMQTLAGRDFDIIHNNSLHYLPIAMANQLATPMVTTLHTPPFWEMAGSVQLRPHGNSFFVAVSESIRKSWSAVMDVDFTIPNGVNLEKFVFQPRPSAAPYLFWFGRIVPEKGLHLAIEAARLAGIALLCAGPISDAGYFESAIRPNLSDQAKYLGHLSHERLTALMGGARACICTPMWEEPYGLVVAEALACGTPVAGFARGALPDLIDCKSGILVKPGDVQALASAMHAALTLSRQDCRDQAERICDAARMIKAYESLYDSVCGRVEPVSGRTWQPDWYSGLLSRESLKSCYLRNMSAGFLEAAPPG